MIDIDYYAKEHLGVNATKWLKYFAKREYKNLSILIYTMKNVDLNWITHDDTRREITILCSTFGISLEQNKLDFKGIMEIIVDKGIEISTHVEFSQLEFRSGSYTRGLCPSCKKRELYVPDQGKADGIVCNRKNACGYTASAYSYLKDNRKKTAKEAFEILAEIANTSVDEINYDNEVHTNEIVSFTKKPKQIKKTPVQIIEDKKVAYISFDSNKEENFIDFNKFLPEVITTNTKDNSTVILYNKLDNLQRWKVFVTAIYNFSLHTKQWGKENYFKKIGISAKKNPILSEKVMMIHKKLGFLHLADIKNLINYLLDDCKFIADDLVEYGLIAHKNSKRIMVSIEEGLIVVPNFDMYTNMVTGLKLRKTKLKTWIDKESGEIKTDKNKEPEFSYKRIANPLPYHLTRESLLDKSMKFRFFEGQKDLHSMPSKKGYCDIAIPGTSGINEEMLGLFKGRIVELYFDQDDAGQKGALKLKKLLEKAGVIVLNITWDITLGADVNDVLQKGNIFKII
ncbi:MAG: hypothetical protein DRG78_15700 [Epsilonproteobacteria bacterium]|nr:MAG: hypothetical protein DRG78_15700 [Campylobacterota bacterium]